MVLDRFFPYWAQMITSMRRCVSCNDLWTWLISSRSFRHDFAIKLLKFVTSCHVHPTACTVLDGWLREAGYRVPQVVEINELFVFALLVNQWSTISSSFSCIKIVVQWNWTYWGLNKVSTILQMTISKAFKKKKNVFTSTRISLKSVSKVLFEYKSNIGSSNGLKASLGHNEKFVNTTS